MKWVPIEILLNMDLDKDDSDVNSSNVMIVEFLNSMFKILEEYQMNCKGPAKFDTLAEFIIESNFVDEKRLTNDNEKIDFKNEKKYFAYILAFTQNLIEVYFSSQTEKIKITQNEALAKDRNLKEQKKKFEKKLESVQKEIDRLRADKSNLELRVDQYDRQK